MSDLRKTGRSLEVGRRSTTLAVLALAAGLGAALLAAPASAVERERQPPRVTVRFESSEFQFRGHVDSIRRCERKRSIVVFGRTIGRDVPVGHGRTGPKGRYRIDPEQLIVGADYYAIARPSEGKRRASCDRAVSKRFRVGL